MIGLFLARTYRSTHETCNFCYVGLDHVGRVWNDRWRSVRCWLRSHQSRGMDQIKMKQTILAVAVISALGLSACSTTKTADVGTKQPVNPGVQQAISEQRLVNDFKRQGVRVIYSTFGSLEAIEATGYAPVWGNSENAAREAFRVAELEAKKALNDFINSENIRSSTSVKMVSRNIERARDNKTNNIATNRDNVAAAASDEEVFEEDRQTGSSQNTAVRNDALNIASRVSTEISVRSQGILSGLRLVEGEVINDGRNVRVVYRWDLKHQDARKQIRQLMMQ